MGNVTQLLFRKKFQNNAANKNSVNNSFLKQFIDHTVFNKTKSPEFEIIEKERTALTKKGGVIEVTDFSSKKKGNRPYITEIRKIRQILKNESCKPEIARIIYHIIQHTESQNILELGTSFGISTSYMAMANSKARLTTIEGCYGLSDMANQLFKKFQLNNINIENGNIDFLLPNILAGLDKLDFVFFDVFRDEATLVEYYKQCSKHAYENTIFVINNIHDSKEMLSCWNTIKKDEKIQGSIDLFNCGILFFNKKANNEHIKLSY
jgi:predicted O-methyltransferase YrrM